MVKDPGVVLRETILTFLITWGIMETICFWVIPMILRRVEAADMKYVEGMSQWFIPSIIAGIVGSFIAGYASSGIAASKGLLEAKKKQQGRTIASVLGLIGFVGVAFPMAYGVFVFFQTVSGTDWDSLFNTVPDVIK